MANQTEAGPTREQIVALIAELGETDPAKAKLLSEHLAKLDKGSKGKRMTEDDILGKRKHAIAGTLRYNEEAKKQEMDFQCQFPGCENIETAFTSDLHQRDHCEEHREAAQKAKAEAKKAFIKDALEKAKQKNISARQA